jgi:hypothetical protein
MSSRRYCNDSKVGRSSGSTFQQSNMTEYRTSGHPDICRREHAREMAVNKLNAKAGVYEPWASGIPCPLA